MQFVKEVTGAVAFFTGVVCLASLTLLRPGALAHPAAGETSMTTVDRIRMPGIWPTKGTSTAEEFIGDAECAKCHTSIAQTQQTTAMGRASAPADSSEILRQNSPLSFHSGIHAYEIARKGTSFQFSVSDGNELGAATLSWAFGLGNKGQTYLYRENGSWYESRLSFYKALQGLEATTGDMAAKSYSLDEALGRPMDAGDARRCFGCHTSQSTTSGRFHPETAIPGVRCESCHGAGSKHVAAMKAGKIDAGRAAILNPRKLAPVASVDFCGACHRTWGDVVDEGIVGVASVRFQPYRLENSRCWSTGDARLTCIACHNPHEPLGHDAESYDAKCLQCHLTTADPKRTKDHPGAACRVATSNCVSCHMPKVEIPSMHAPFTDHFIRVVRTSAP